MELKNLVGEHYLSGLDSIIEKAKERWEDDGAAFVFILDGIIYKAVEDPSDGYRSYLRSLEVVKGLKVSYTFPPQKVIGKMKPSRQYEENDTIQFMDANSGEVVLEIGTDNYDDYYPTCVMNWYPQKLTINL